MSSGDERLRADIGRVVGKVEQEETATEGLGFSTGRQSLESPLVEIPELVNNYVRIGDLSLLIGFGGVGKSTIALNLALALAGGVPFIGYDISSAERVAHIDLEMGEYEFRTRLNMLLPQYPEIAKDNFYWKCLQNFTMKDRRNEARLKNELAIVHPKLLIVDNHASFHGGDPNKESDMMTNVIIPLREIMAEFGVGVLYLMHTPWMERDRPRGSAAIFDAASTVIAMTKDLAKPDIRTLRWTKRRSVRRNMGASMVEIGYNEKTYMVYPSLGRAVDAVLDSITFPAKQPVIANAIAEGLGITRAPSYKRIAKMLEDGQLVRRQDGLIDRGLRRLRDVIEEQRE